MRGDTSATAAHTGTHCTDHDALRDAVRARRLRGSTSDSTRQLRIAAARGAPRTSSDRDRACVGDTSSRSTSRLHATVVHRELLMRRRGGDGVEESCFASTKPGTVQLPRAPDARATLFVRKRRRRRRREAPPRGEALEFVEGVVCSLTGSIDDELGPNWPRRTSCSPESSNPSQR